VTRKDLKFRRRESTFLKDTNIRGPKLKEKRKAVAEDRWVAVSKEKRMILGGKKRTTLAKALTRGCGGSLEKMNEQADERDLRKT